VIILKIKESENIFKNIIHYITNTHLEEHEKRREKRKENQIKRRCDGLDHIYKTHFDKLI
jgi:hypothetical protein